ncbi:hypothetical protein [Actinacidiphila sp. bgisy160]|uniref:hypothetical protein n=1 Tax=Actinacidiphila sp. bgisy160 TaxID=3413796 RepID=UPI003D74DB49
MALLAASGVERQRDDVVPRPLDPPMGTRRHFLAAGAGQRPWPPIATVARLLMGERAGDRGGQGVSGRF